MRLKKSLQLAINIFLHSKLRSWLTIIGIIVGIGAVVSIVSMSLGAQQQLQERLGSLGADILTITPGMQRAGGFGFGGDRGPGGELSAGSAISKNLTSKDIVVLKSVDNVKYVMGQISGRDDISYSSQTIKSQSITGIDITVWKDITTETLSSGRFLTSGDSYGVVIGQNLATNTFTKPITLNAKLTINGQSFIVVGIVSEGRSIYMPIEIARPIFKNSDSNYIGDNNFNSISVKISDVSLANQTVTDITKKLMLSRGILQQNKADFSVSNPAAFQQTIQATLGVMTLFLAAIAAISLLVGAIGIANTMFTAVLEKTKEIGIMKAIGTKNRDIMTIFLLNSGLIGLVGGIGGIIVGLLASDVINSMAGISTSTGGRGAGGMLNILGGSSVISLPLIIGALLFAVLIGMIAGAIPAYRASRLNPVDALRYE